MAASVTQFPGLVVGLGWGTVGRTTVVAESQRIADQRLSALQHMSRRSRKLKRKRNPYAFYLSAVRANG